MSWDGDKKNSMIPIGTEELAVPYPLLNVVSCGCQVAGVDISVGKMEWFVLI